MGRDDRSPFRPVLALTQGAVGLLDGPIAVDKAEPGGRWVDPERHKVLGKDSHGPAADESLAVRLDLLAGANDDTGNTTVFQGRQDRSGFAKNQGPLALERKAGRQLQA